MKINLKKNILYSFSGFLVGFLLMFIFFFPIWSDKSLYDSWFAQEKQQTVPAVADEDVEAYDIWTAPSNSFGMSSMKTVNWSYFKQLFNSHTGWVLEYKRYSSSPWTVGNQYLTISKDWNESGFWKINLTLDVPVDVYSVRFTFGCNLSVLDYVERDGFEVWLNYSANQTETYSVMFNWSDIASIPNLVITHGKTDNLFWFRFRRDNVPAGHYEFDPTFGFSDLTGFSIWQNNIDYSIGPWGLVAGGDGAVDNISVYMKGQAAGQLVTCSLYQYVDYSSSYAGNNLGNTEQKTIGVENSPSWTVFNFTGTKPPVVNNTKYYIILQMDVSGNGIVFYRKSNSGYSIYEGHAYSPPFENPWSGESTSTNVLAVYASYTVSAPPAGNTAPTISCQNPANASTGIALGPLVSVCVNDTEGNATTVCWYENSTGSWVLSQVNTSQVPNSTASWTYTNADSYSDTFWWNVTVDDGQYNVSSWNKFTTLAKSWQPVSFNINGSGYNITLFQSIDFSINGSGYNITTLSWTPISYDINGSGFNLSVFQPISFDINGSGYNITTYTPINFDINGSGYNKTISMQPISYNINGSGYNLTQTLLVNHDINGSGYNTSVLQTISFNINGSGFNTTTFYWTTIDFSINGSGYNQTNYQPINYLINGSGYNTTTYYWTNINLNINGSGYNLTQSQPINYNINGSGFNTTTLYLTSISYSINGSGYNLTTYTPIDYTINGSGYNTTAPTIISLTNPTPITTVTIMLNRTNLTQHSTDIQLSITRNHTDGLDMNTSFYFNNTLLTTNTSYGNGTITLWIFNYTTDSLQSGTLYSWSVNCTDTNNVWENQTYSFTLKTKTGTTKDDQLLLGIIIGTMLCFYMIYLVIKRRKYEQE